MKLYFSWLQPLSRLHYLQSDCLKNDSHLQSIMKLSSIIHCFSSAATDILELNCTVKANCAFFYCLIPECIALLYFVSCIFFSFRFHSVSLSTLITLIVYCIFVCLLSETCVNLFWSLNLKSKDKFDNIWHICKLLVFIMQELLQSELIPI